jgi:gliding motility-associated-like protein/uncharacterized repeat protein (TIGR01451 family)
MQFCTADNSTLADVAVQVTGINLIFWDAATNGTQLAQTTVLTDGQQVWVSQGTGTCADRLLIDIQVDDVVAAPTADTPMQFCTADNNTLADVAVQVTGVNLIFWDAATNGTQLAQTTVLTDGQQVWVSQGTGTCADRLLIDIQVDDVVAAPTADTPMQFCTADNSTLADVAVQVTGVNLIFWDAATNGTQLAQTTVLTDGQQVWVSQGTGSCADRLLIDIQVDDVVAAPTADTPMQFCTADNSTLADVAVQVTGINLIFWDAATAGNQLPQTTALTDGIQVWVSQGTGTCADRLLIDIQVDDVVEAPIADSPMQFCTADNSTLADVAVQVTGINLIFWDAATNGNQLPQTTVLTDGMQVWVSQGTGSCADRLALEFIEDCSYLEIEKTADLTIVESAGYIINYTITVRNLNVIGVGNISVFDPMLTLVGPVGDENNNDIIDFSEEWVYTGTYTVTQEDIDNGGIGVNCGEIINTATVNGNVSITGTAIDELSASAVVDIIYDEDSPYTITKTADVETVSVDGDVVTYTITVTNTSNYAIYNVYVEDNLLGGELSNPQGDLDNDGVLDVGEIWIYQGTYTITQDELIGYGVDEDGNIDGDGDIDNIVYVNGETPCEVLLGDENASVAVLLDFIFIPDGFSPDGDDTNETFEIIGLADHYPNFTLQIYNRWGNIVFDYKNNGNITPDWWDGFSNGRATIGTSKKVPTGTYYYILDFNDGERKPLVDWIYLTRAE